MKKWILPLLLLFVARAGSGQDMAQLERVIRSGDSEKGFAFVRDLFGLPTSEDPYLHFRPRGIRQLISFCDLRERRVEATSMIRFDQTRTFWANYSRQFTAGRWNYRQLFANDSLAWRGANYAILLIYAHEMGHYMSRRYRADTDAPYSCEEVVANESLAAFSHAFSGRQAAQYRDLFLRMCRQTRDRIPATERTSYRSPMHDWCRSNPMDSFFAYQESNEEKFLRLYGYAQFHMMEEAITTYSGKSWKQFLDHQFYGFFNRQTRVSEFQPLPYRVASVQNWPRQSGALLGVDKVTRDSAEFFHVTNYDGWLHSVNDRGGSFSSFFTKDWLHTAGEDTFYNRHFLVNRMLKGDSSEYLSDLVLDDSVNRVSWNMLSAYNEEGQFTFLLKRFQSNDSSGTSSYYFYHLREGVGPGSCRFQLPDSLDRDKNGIYQQCFIAGLREKGFLLVQNLYTAGKRQRISVYLLDTANRSIGQLLWQEEAAEPGFCNMMYPTFALDTTREALCFCFYNPVSEKIYLYRIGRQGTGKYLLYQQGRPGRSGPQLKVRGLQLAAIDKLYVLARTRRPGNRSKQLFQRLLVQWTDAVPSAHKGP